MSVAPAHPLNYLAAPSTEDALRMMAAMRRLWWAASIWCVVTAAQSAMRFVGRFSLDINLLFSPSSRSWIAAAVGVAMVMIAVLLLALLLLNRFGNATGRSAVWSVGLGVALVAVLALLLEVIPQAMGLFRLYERNTLAFSDVAGMTLVGIGDVVQQATVPAVLLVAYLCGGFLGMRSLGYAAAAWLTAYALTWLPASLQALGLRDVTRGVPALMTDVHAASRIATLALFAGAALVLLVLIPRSQRSGVARVWTIRVTAAAVVVAAPLLFMAYGMSSGLPGGSSWFANYTPSQWLEYGLRLLLLAGGALAALWPAITWPSAQAVLARPEPSGA